MKRLSSIGALVLLIAMLAGCGGQSGSPVPTSATQSSNKNAPATQGAGIQGWIVKPGTTKHTNDLLGGGGSFGLLSGLLGLVLGDAQPALGNMNVASINLGIDAVNIVYKGQVTTIATYSSPYVVNVMANGGDPSAIGIGQVTNANYDHIQFVVDTASSNVTDASGNVYPIQFQSGQTTQSTVGAGKGTVTAAGSGSVTMTVGGSFMVGGTPADSVMADFNALESLNQNSAGQIVAQPTLYSVASDNAGEVQGQVLNANGQPVQNAVVVGMIVGASGTEHVGNTTNTDANGNFDLHAINAGSYQLVIYNNYTTASGQTITASGADASMGASFQGPALTVPAGQITQAGTLND